MEKSVYYIYFTLVCALPMLASNKFWSDRLQLDLVICLLRFTKGHLHIGGDA